LRSRVLPIVAGLTLASAAVAQTGDSATPIERGRPGLPGQRVRNVLLLIADDLGVDKVGIYGAADAPPTPNLDQLARDGVLFRNAWAQPTCSPSRALIQTGRQGFRTTIGQVVSTFSGGPALPLSEMTLPEMLDLGTGGRFAHCLVGKWHLGSSQVGGALAPNLAGYQHFVGSLEGQLPSYTSWDRVVDGLSARVTGYATSVVVDDALAWIQAQDRPWLCTVSFQAPHAPFHRPPAHLHTRTLPAQEPRPSCGAAGADPQPFFDAMVEALDTEIGRLLSGLPDRERTAVIFLGDNGTDRCVSSTPLHSKSSLYEGGVHVPMLVSGAGVARAGESTALVGAADVFATVAELAGVDLAAAFPGMPFDSISLVPYLSEPGRPSLRHWLYAETFTPNGPGNPRALPPCPAAPVCQTDLGFGGPGDARLSMCGRPLYGIYGSNYVPFRLEGAPPGATVTLFIGGYAPAPNPTVGGWLVSNPPAAAHTFHADATGVVEAALWTADTSHELHYQCVVENPAFPSGFEVSNAVRIDPLWTDMQALRGLRYKLIRFDPCREELYDLVLDPTEQHDLLRAPLTTEQGLALAALRHGLELAR